MTNGIFHFHWKTFRLNAENLKELVKELELTDKVVFTGPVENEKTAYYYKAADFFISASTSETQGLTYLEAMAAGTRVLAAKNPYLSELINDDEFGQLFIGMHESLLGYFFQPQSVRD